MFSLVCDFCWILPEEWRTIANILISGASRGLGRAMAEEFSDRQYMVHAGTRSGKLE